MVMCDLDPLTLITAIMWDPINYFGKQSMSSGNKGWSESIQTSTFHVVATKKDLHLKLPVLVLWGPFHKAARVPL